MWGSVILKNIDFNNLSREELLIIKKKLLCEIKEKQEIVCEIDKKLVDEKFSDFSSSYIPYYKKENEEACFEILSDIELNDLYFFVESFYESGNNYRRIDYFEINNKNPLTDMAKIYDTAAFYLRNILGMTRTKNIFSSERIIDNYEVIFPLSKLIEFFKISDYAYGYEKTYNNFNYIVNYIYQCLDVNPNATYNDVFKDFYDKQILVRDNFAEISSYLYSIRGDGDLKLSVSNAGLKRNKDKVASQLTFRQQRLIEAIAFGTTLEKLKMGNYEDSKRLIYLPTKK